MDLINLDRHASTREDIRGFLKYSLHLDYELPKTNSSDNIVDLIISSTKACCFPVLKKNPHGHYHFFGYIPEFEKTSIFQHMDSPNPPVNVASLEDFMIYDCIMFCYHVLLNRYTSNLKPTPYAVNTKIKNIGYNELIDKKSIIIDKSNHLKFQYTKSPDDYGDSSNFIKQYKSHIKLMDEVWKTDNLPASNYSFADSNSVYLIATTKKPILKLLYSTKDNKASKAESLEVLKAIKEIKNLVCNPISHDELSSSSYKTDLLYQYYLNESFFNIDLEYTLLSMLIYQDKKNYEMTDMHSLRTICSCCNLQNIFSRKIFINYAFCYIDSQNNSYDNFWKDHQSSQEDDIFSSKYKFKKPSRFSYDQWLEQFELFTGYFSKYVFPIYAWGFLSLFLDTIERDNPELEHVQQIEIGLKTLADYIDTHYQAYSNMINELKTKTIRDMDIAYSSTILDVHNTFINNFPLSRSVPFVNRSIVMNSDLNIYGNVVERDAIIDFYTNLIKYNRILSESNN